MGFLFGREDEKKEAKLSGRSEMPNNPQVGEFLSLRSAKRKQRTRREPPAFLSGRRQNERIMFFVGQEERSEGGLRAVLSWRERVEGSRGPGKQELKEDCGFVSEETRGSRSLVRHKGKK